MRYYAALERDAKLVYEVRPDERRAAAGCRSPTTSRSTPTRSTYDRTGPEVAHLPPAAAVSAEHVTYPPERHRDHSCCRPTTSTSRARSSSPRAAAAGPRRTRWSAPSWSATARCSARASTPPTARAHAEREALRRVRRRADRRGDAVRLAGAVLPPGPDAAVHGRDPRGRASPASWSPPTTRPRRPPAAASGSCATRASRSWSPTASWPPARGCSTSRSASTRAPGIPWVLFKSAMTLDGKVATRTGDSKWISGEDSRRLAHRWRAECDAVACGIGTALADDPQLTARIEGVHRQPRRIVFDSEARLPLDSALIRERARAAAHGRRLARRPAPRHRRPRGRRRRRDRRHRRERAGPRAQRARPARRRRHHLDPARGRPAPGRRVPRRRRGRRDPPVRRARRGRRLAPRATRSRARASSASPRPPARSRSSASASPTTC